MLKKIRVYDLQVGMFVVDTGLSWLDHPMLYSHEGHITSEEQIKRIREDGFAELFIETDKDKQHGGATRIYAQGELEGAMAEAKAHEDAHAASNKDVPLAVELEAALAVHKLSLEVVRQVFSAVAQGAAFDPSACHDVSRGVSTSVSRNRDALVCLAWLGENGSHAARHSVSVSVLAAAFGHFLGFDRVKVGELALAGLLHDVGKAASLDYLQAGASPASPDDVKRLKMHPVESCSVLSARMNLPRHVLLGISEHHERHDGSGYPRGSVGAKQSSFGRILAMADVYDILTHDGPGGQASPPGKALGAMYAKRNQHFEAQLLERFIKCLGIYTVGSLVRLSTGEHAFVRESNPEAPLRPKVLVSFDSAMRPMHPVSVDLAGAGGVSPARPVDIREVLDHRLYNLKPLDFLA